MSSQDLNDGQGSGRGSHSNDDEPRFLIVGRVGKPHGVRGEVRVTIHTDEPERFTWLEEAHVGIDRPYPLAIESARFHKNWVLLKFDGYDNRDAVEKLRGEWLQVRLEDAIELEDGELFLYQLIGLEMVTTEGKLIGNVKEIIETGANNVFVVKGTAGEKLIPDIDDVVNDIDLAAGQITVTLIPGL